MKQWAERKSSRAPSSALSLGTSFPGLIVTEVSNSVSFCSVMVRLRTAA